MGDLRPDLTLILDLPAEEGLRRAARRRAPGAALDRFEGEDLRFHEALRACFLAIAAANPGRCAVIDASAPEADVADAIEGVVSERLLGGRGAERAHGA